MPRRSSRGGDNENGGGGGNSRQWRSRSRSRGRLGGGDQSHDGTNNDTSVGYASTGGASTATGVNSTAANITGVNGGGTSASGNGDYFVTSPPPVRKSSLTGNISSLFRTAFNRGGSGNDQHRQRQNISLDQQQQAQAQEYTPPLGSVTSPERSTAYHRRNENDSTNNKYSGTQYLGSATSKQKQRGSRFGFGGGGGGDDDNKNKSNNNVYHNTGNISVASESTGGTPGKSSSRLFYSNADDDSNSDNSFDEQSRSSRRSHSCGTRATTSNTFVTGDYTEGTGSNTYDDDATSYITDESGTLSKSQSRLASSKISKKDQRRRHPSGDDEGLPSTTILRYRGFSTSIQSLFLDEALVCASMGCFGLILSNRTEFLLQLRNDRRGVQWGRSSSRRTLPSRIVAYALLLTLLLIGITFVIWGFGSNSDSTNPFAFNSGGYNKGGSATSSSSSGNNNVDYNYNDDTDNQNDDGGNNNNEQNDDNANNNNNDDDDGANDDGGYNNYYNNNNDDEGNNQAVDDDDANANAAANDDEDYNDDGGNNNYYYDYDDDDANANGGRQLDRQATRRRQQTFARIDDAKDTTNVLTVFSPQRQQHGLNGIFKIRDMKEAIWEPTIDFLSDEWYRPHEARQSARQTRYQRQHQYSHRKRNLQNNDDNYTNNGDVSSSSSGSKRDLASDLRISLFVAFLIVLGILGRRRRMRTRYYLVRARAQEDHLFYASSGTGIKRVGFQDSREDQYEGACSHTLCGCYPIDPPREGDEIEDEVQVNDEGVSQQKKKPHNEDCVGRGFNCLLGLCCGFICKCWFQCLSICALAQEAREIRLLVPTRFQRVDYITHQPFHEYQKEVNDLRRGWMGKTRKKSGIMPHFNALSRLSRYILVLSLLLTIVVAATLFFNPRASFSWPDVIILSATFLQSFLVIWVVHWIFHKSDLSLDAVIKFFAAGFVIAVPSAFFFEGVLINITFSSAYLVYGLGEFMGGQTFEQWITQHYRLLWIVAEIFNAYIVATVTEELCKYYTFRCVEHPDLIFLTGLVSTTQDERALEGGVVKYPFSSHQVQRTNMKNPYDDDASHYSRSSRNSHRSKGSEKNVGLDPNEAEFCEDEQDVRTHRQKAAAVTTSMISVAVGLACAENFLYVFLLGGTGSTSGVEMEDGTSAMDGYLQEWIVLFFRSVFPVHALAAAMQSVNMIRKFVETEDVNGHRIGVGRIILPAVIMHGSFDAILLGINFFIETSWEDYMEENDGDVDEGNPSPYNPVVVNIIAWLSIILVMLAGILWYYNENRSQRLRLIELEEQEKVNQVGSSGYTSPKAPHVSDVELV